MSAGQGDFVHYDFVKMLFVGWNPVFTAFCDRCDDEWDSVAPNGICIDRKGRDRGSGPCRRIADTKTVNASILLLALWDWHDYPWGDGCDSYDFPEQMA